MTPFTFPLDAQRRAVELATETVDRADAAPEAVDRFSAVEVGQTPSEVVYRENKLTLHHYHPETVGAEVEHDVPILVVYALINRPYILDLQPDRSVLRRLLEAGFEVYMIDWGEPSQLDTSLTLDDYVNRYVDRCVDVACDEAGLDRVHLLGYCMGGTMSAMYTALHPENVRTLGLMAAGLCFDGTGGVLEKWGDEQFYDPADVVETFGNVPADFLAVGFDLMDPVNNYVTKYLNLYENLDDEEFVENFARMETWISDGIDVAGETYREFLEEVYQDNALYENDLEVGGDSVDLDRIDVPVLQVVGEYDHLIPPEASTPFNEVVGSDDVTAMEFPTGHIGLSVSSRSHEELWPAVADWYAERSEVESDEPEDEAGVDEPEVDVDADAGNDTDAEEADEADDLQLVSVRGVGPTYADTLRSAGIESVTDLATADPAELAAATDIPEGRLRDIVEDARDRVDD